MRHCHRLTRLPKRNTSRSKIWQEMDGFCSRDEFTPSFMTQSWMQRDVREWFSGEDVVVKPLSDTSLWFETCVIMRSDDDSRLANEFVRSFLRRYEPLPAANADGIVAIRLIFRLSSTQSDVPDAASRENAVR